MPLTREDIAGADAVLVLNILPEGLAYQWTAQVLDPEEVVALTRKAASAIAAEHGVRSCRVCGCTDLSACNPPCSWSEADLCSSHEAVA